MYEFWRACKQKKRYFMKKFLTGTPATFNAAAWQFLLSSICAWVIRTFRISNFEGCSGEPCPVSRHSASTLLMLCLTRVKTEHICRDISNWHPPLLPPFCHLVLFLSHVMNRSTRITLATHSSAHTFCITNTLLCVELRGMWRWAKELKLFFQQYRWSRAARMMTRIHFPLWLWRFSENRAKDQSEGNSWISHEN